MGARFLSASEARGFYDRFGRKLDTQAFYEDPALDVLLREGGFDDVRSVMEFGCGTGRLAERMLDGILPATARYAGCDISPVMIGLAQQRLARFGSRVTLWQSGDDPDLGPGNPPFERIVSTFVLELLPDATRAAFLATAAEALAPGGRLCTTVLTRGTGPLSRIVSGLWNGVARIDPRLVGGCRPLSILPQLDPATWRIVYSGTVTPWAIPSEIVVAELR